MAQQTPESVLLGDVSVPAFFAKLAAETGYTPSDAETSTQVLGTGNLVTLAVDLYFQKEAASATFASESVVKAAAEAAFNVAGVTQQQQPQTKPAQYLESSAVRDAALMMVANEIAKKASAPGVAPAMNPQKTEEEEEEEGKAPKVELPK